MSFLDDIKNDPIQAEDLEEKLLEILKIANELYSVDSEGYIIEGFGINANHRVSLSDLFEQYLVQQEP